MEYKRFKLAGLNFHSIDFYSALDELENLIKSDSSHMVNTITAELAVMANEDLKLKHIYNNCTLLMLDSYVLYYVARLFRKPVNEPVNAARLLMSFLEVAQNKKYRLYFLGSRLEILEAAVRNIRAQYPGVEICGWHHGYFDFNQDDNVITSINNAKPDIVFIGMSSPLKETLGYKYSKLLNVPVFMGIGGAIDVFGGKTKLAPLKISKLGLEWFYRLVQEPGRMWKRYTLTNLKFIWLLIKIDIFRK